MANDGGVGNVLGSAGSGAAAGSVAGPWGAVIGAGVGLVSGIIGNLIGAGKEEEAKKIAEKAWADYGSLKPEAIEKAAAEVLGPSELAKYRVNPQLQNAQMQALEALAEIDREGGLTLADKAVLNQNLNQVNRANAARRNAILEQMAARGTLNSGAAYSLQQQENQAAAERANQAGLAIAGQAQNNRMNALLRRGGLAGDIRGQDFGEQSAVARAQDEITRYNAGARERAYDRNADNQKWLYGAQEAKAQNVLKGQLGDAERVRGEGQNAAAMAAGIGRGAGQVIDSLGRIKWEDDEDRGY